MKNLIAFLLMFSLQIKAETLAKVEAKGFLVKDRIEVVVFDDPTIKGIACYTTIYVRPMSLSDDSTNSSLACRRIAKIEGNLVSMNNVFQQNKAFLSLYKETVVDRFYDSKRNVLVYLSYTKSWGEKNTSHSISVVPITE